MTGDGLRKSQVKGLCENVTRFSNLRFSLWSEFPQLSTVLYRSLVWQIEMTTTAEMPSIAALCLEESKPAFYALFAMAKGTLAQVFSSAVRSTMLLFLRWHEFLYRHELTAGLSVVTSLIMVRSQHFLSN